MPSAPRIGALGHGIRTVTGFLLGTAARPLFVGRACTIFFRWAADDRLPPIACQTGWLTRIRFQLEAIDSLVPTTARAVSTSMSQATQSEASAFLFCRALSFVFRLLSFSIKCFLQNGYLFQERSLFSTSRWTSALILLLIYPFIASCMTEVTSWRTPTEQSYLRDILLRVTRLVTYLFIYFILLHSSVHYNVSELIKSNAQSVK